MMDDMEDLIELALGVGGVAGALIVAGIAIVGLGLILHMSSRRTRSILVYFAFPLLFSVMVGTLVSGRDFSVALENKKVESPLLSLANWGATLFFLIGVVERFATALFHKRIESKVPLMFLISYIVAWCTMVGIPMYFGAVPKPKHDFTYMLFIGVAMLLSDPDDFNRAVKSTRNAIMLFLLASMMALAVSRNLTLDLDYATGLLPGVPRYAGLAPGAVGMGTLCLIGILCLWVRPFESRGLNVWAWTLIVSSFIIAQVKTAWLAFIFCWAAMMWIKYGRQMVHNVSRGRYVGTSLLVLCSAAIGILGITAITLFGDVGSKVMDLESSKTGGELTSFTGRDQIWRVALDEWQRYPILGYGPTLFDDEYRQTIGMPFATHGHNQYIDVLARAGLVGATGLTAFLIAFLIMAVKASKRTGGLSMALFMLVVVRCVSEVPVHFWGYGTEAFTIFLVLYSAVLPRKEYVAATLTPLHGTHEPVYYGHGHGHDDYGHQPPHTPHLPIEPTMDDLRALR